MTARLHPLVRITLYAVLFWYVNTFALDVIWRIANP
jgi:hypothetical protein